MTRGVKCEFPVNEGRKIHNRITGLNEGSTFLIKPDQLKHSLSCATDDQSETEILPSVLDCNKICSFSQRKGMDRQTV